MSDALSQIPEAVAATSVLLTTGQRECENGCATARFTPPRAAPQSPNALAAANRLSQHCVGRRAEGQRVQILQSDDDQGRTGAPLPLVGLSPHQPVEQLFDAPVPRIGIDPRHVVAQRHVQEHDQDDNCGDLQPGRRCPVGWIADGSAP